MMRKSKQCSPDAKLKRLRRLECLLQKGETMEEFKITYCITVWTWDGKNYEPVTVLESEELEECKRKYDSMNTDIDHPLIQIWEMGEEDRLIEYKES